MTCSSLFQKICPLSGCEASFFLKLPSTATAILMAGLGSYNIGDQRWKVSARKNRLQKHFHWYLVPCWSRGKTVPGNKPWVTSWVWLPKVHNGDWYTCDLSIVMMYDDDVLWSMMCDDLWLWRLLMFYDGVRWCKMYNEYSTGLVWCLFAWFCLECESCCLRQLIQDQITLCMYIIYIYSCIYLFIFHIYLYYIYLACYLV